MENVSSNISKPQTQEYIELDIKNEEEEDSEIEDINDNSEIKKELLDLKEENENLDIEIKREWENRTITIKDEELDYFKIKEETETLDTKLEIKEEESEVSENKEEGIYEDNYFMTKLESKDELIDFEDNLELEELLTSAISTRPRRQIKKPSYYSPMPKKKKAIISEAYLRIFSLLSKHNEVEPEKCKCDICEEDVEDYVLHLQTFHKVSIPQVRSKPHVVKRGKPGKCAICYEDFIDITLHMKRDHHARTKHTNFIINSKQGKCDLCKTQFKDIFDHIQKFHGAPKPIRRQLNPTMRCMGILGNFKNVPKDAISERN